MEQQHVIGKLSLEVDLSSREEVFALQGRLSNACNAQLTPLLSALLDTWADPDVLLQIDKLEIDLGQCTQEMLEKELPGLVVAYLQEHYPHIRQEAYLQPGMERIPVGQGYFESWLYFLEHGVLPHAAIKWTRLEWEAGILSVLSTETKACWQCEKLLLSNPHALKRLLLQFSRPFVQNWVRAYSASVCEPLLQLASEWETFLYHPQLPEIIERTGLRQLQVVPALPSRADFHLLMTEWLIREAVLPGQQEGNAVLLEGVIQLLPKADVKYWVYLLEQIPVTEMKALPLLQQAALTLTGKYKIAVSAIKEELALKRPYISNNEVGVVGDDKRSSEEDVRGNLVDEKEVVSTASSSSPTASTAVSEEITSSSAVEIVSTAVSEEVTSPSLVETASSAPGETVSSSSAVSHDASENASDLPLNSSSASASNSSSPSSSSSSNSSPAENILVPSSSAENNADDIEPPAEGTTLYINNAGLILLHPYLAILFDSLGLREGKVFKDDAAVYKAIQLLGYLGCGEDNIPEYDLVFPKLLCGILPAQPIARFVPLSDQEKTEADELLLAVIGHWNVLGSTTPDGLRGNFLMREGKLIWKDEEWQLYVSQQSYDMLLNRLPWGFSVVGLSWMPWLIKTVWT